VGQFKFECCPLVQEISSLWSTTCPALEVVYRCVCLLRVQCCKFISLSFLWGRLCSTLPHHCLCFNTVHCLIFSFAGQFSFGCCSLAQEMSSVIHYLPCFGEWLITTHFVFTAFPCLFTDSLALRLALCLSPFLWCSFSIPPLCSPCLITVCSLLFSFVGGRAQSAQGLCWIMFPGVDKGFCMVRGTHLFVLSNDMQASLELAVVRNGTKFSQCNVVWEGFPWARSSRYRKFDSGWFFISKCGSNILYFFFSDKIL
jgi:hypothetical protein